MANLIFEMIAVHLLYTVCFDTINILWWEMYKYDIYTIVYIVMEYIWHMYFFFDQKDSVHIYNSMH